GQVLGPQLVEPEADTLDQLERAVAECGQAGDPQFVRVEAMQAADESMEEVLARVDIDAADDPLGELAEVGGEMEEQVGAGGEQEHAAQGAFDRDHAKDESCARRVAGPHRQSLSTSACRSDVLDTRRPAESRIGAARCGLPFSPERRALLSIRPAWHLESWSCFRQKA